MTTHPDAATVRAAVSLACRAPSVHNSQPWKWQTAGNGTVQLFADRSRQLAEADPRGRDLVISCGAALHHLQVALVAAGWAPRVHRLPDERNPDHFATVEMVAATPDDAQLKLAAAISRRRSERRRLSSWDIPEQHLQHLAEAAQQSGALLAGSSELQIRHRLIFAFSEAAARQGQDPE